MSLGLVTHTQGGWWGGDENNEEQWIQKWRVSPASQCWLTGCSVPAVPWICNDLLLTKPQQHWDMTHALSGSFGSPVAFTITLAVPCSKRGDVWKEERQNDQFLDFWGFVVITRVVRSEVACAKWSCHREGEQEGAEGASWGRIILSVLWETIAVNMGLP